MRLKRLPGRHLKISSAGRKSWSLTLCLAGTLSVVLYLPPFNTLEGAQTFFIISFLCAASGRALLSYGPTSAGRAGFFLIASSIGMFLGSAVPVTRYLTMGYSGLPLERVSGFTGYLNKDSMPLKKGGYGYTLDLTEVSDSLGNTADARGQVWLISSDGPPRFWGSRIEVDAPLSREEGSRGTYRAFGSPLDDGPTGWKHPLYGLRREWTVKLVQRASILSPDSGALFKALFFGIQDDLDIFESTSFRKAGCSHILALSGMHLGIISGLFLLVLQMFFRKSLAFLLSLGIVAVYIALVGLKPSLVRAAVMYALSGLCITVNRRIDIFQIFLCSFVLLVLLLPGDIHTLSFQLSFLALLGIILIGKNIHFRLSPYVPAWLSLALACSLSAHIFTSALSMHVFGEVYPIGIIAGIVLTPLIFCFIWGGMVFLLFTDVPVLVPWFRQGMDRLYSGIDHSIRVFSSAPSIRYDSVRGMTVYLCILFVILVFVLIPFKRQLK